MCSLAMTASAGADLIVSHAGSGSVFEAMALRKPVIAVPNAILMHNHQACDRCCAAAPHLVQNAPPGLAFAVLRRLHVSRDAIVCEHWIAHMV